MRLLWFADCMSDIPTEVPFIVTLAFSGDLTESDGRDVLPSRKLPPESIDGILAGTSNSQTYWINQRKIPDDMETTCSSSTRNYGTPRCLVDEGFQIEKLTIVHETFFFHG